MIMSDLLLCGSVGYLLLRGCVGYLLFRRDRERGIVEARRFYVIESRICCGLSSSEFLDMRVVDAEERSVMFGECPFL